MKYLTGIYALNLPCNLNTCGDWHSKSINWNHPDIRESSNSVLKDYGIELHRSVQYLDCKEYNVANHIRALLDMLICGNYGYAQGMKDEYICNDHYTKEIFDNVKKLENEKNWNEINDFMKKEYKLQWLNYIDTKKIKTEVSHKNRNLKLEKYININDVDKLMGMKINAYNRENNIQDLYDIVFIMKNYKDSISDILIEQLKNSFEYKGLEQFDYLIKTQDDTLIDKDKLAENLLELYDDLGLIDSYSDKLENEISNIQEPEDDEGLEI